jgi:hypothetical protein
MAAQREINSKPDLPPTQKKSKTRPSPQKVEGKNRNPAAISDKQTKPQNWFFRLPIPPSPSTASCQSSLKE